MDYSKLKVVIIDNGLGNLFSVKHACLQFGVEANVSSDPKDLLGADAALLPGVGAFSRAMDNLSQTGLVEAIGEFVKSGRPLFGICLGLQLLFDTSEEFGNSKGLGIVKGKIKKFPQASPQGKPLRVPFIGWNEISEANSNWADSPLDGLSKGEMMYFVHSFYAIPDETNVALSFTNYCGIEYCSSIQCDNVFATQFHPEKSGKSGLQIYSNWFRRII